MNPCANVEVDNESSERKRRRRAAGRQNFGEELDNVVFFR
jgi:hypothetical protein